MSTPFEPLEGLLNRRIEDSSQARRLCDELDGQTLALQLSDTRLVIYFTVSEQRLSLDYDFEDDPDVIISTGMTGLLGLASDDAQKEIRSGRVHISGDAGSGQAFQELLKLTRPDWEEELSRLTGDVAAHQIGVFVRSGLDFGRRVFETISQNASEFLKEESRDLPSRPEIDRWLADVDRLREDCDRLEARLERREQRESAQ